METIKVFPMPHVTLVFPLSSQKDSAFERTYCTQREPKKKRKEKEIGSPSKPTIIN